MDKREKRMSRVAFSPTGKYDGKSFFEMRIEPIFSSLLAKAGVSRKEREIPVQKLAGKAARCKEVSGFLHGVNPLV